MSYLSISVYIRTKLKLAGNCKNLNFCHFPTEAATDDISKSAKRAKRGNAGSVYSSETALVQRHYIFRALLFHMSRS